MTADNMISRDDARALVGKMLFGSDWISGLTKEQKALLDDFGPQRKLVFRGDVAVNTIDVFTHPCPAERRQDFDIAMGRRERIRIQGLTIDDWIDTVVGVDPANAFLDRALLASAMKHQQQQGDRPDTGAKKSRGPQSIERNRVVKEMKDAIANGTSVQALCAMKQAALASLFNTGRGTACDALKEVLSELESAGTPTNSDTEQ